jgi:hypothetical protein
MFGHLRPEGLSVKLQAAHLDFQVVKTPEEADTILRFNNHRVPRERPLTAAERREMKMLVILETDAEESSGVSTMPPPGEGVVIIRKKDGSKVAITPELETTPASSADKQVKKSRAPSPLPRQFAVGFIHLYKAANEK